MQNQQKSSRPSFRSLSSIPMVIPNFIFGLFWVFFALFFLAAMLFLLSNSSEEMGFDIIASVALFFILLIALIGIALVLIYSIKKMYTTTIIDEKGIHYLNKFNNKVIKELPWSSFAKREKLAQVLESPKYDITLRTPYKSVFDQFSWPILVNNKIEIHSEVFSGRHFFCMFYSNRTELIRTFLLGVTHYRADITIDPAIFKDHYINPESYIIDYREQKRVKILSALFYFFILALLYFFVIRFN